MTFRLRDAALLCAGAILCAMPGVAGAAPSLCDSGRRQSPIDITGAQQADLPALRFDYRPTPLRLVNDGHTVRVRVGKDQRMRLGATIHAVQQMHFHVPGGDRIDGREFDMAMHFLHKSPAGQLVVVVALFRVGAPHAALAALLPRMPETKGAERTIAGATVDPAQFLPTTPGYFRYEGSETSPPCTEGVTWLVLKQIQELSAEQLAQLGKRFPRNTRAVQPLNGRPVQASR